MEILKVSNSIYSPRIQIISIEKYCSSYIKGIFHKNNKTKLCLENISCFPKRTRRKIRFLHSLEYKRYILQENSDHNELINLLKTIQVIKNVYTQFSRNAKITDDYIKEFLKSIRGNKQLTMMQIRLLECRELNDSGINQFRTFFKRTKDLFQLHFTFYAVPNLTDAGFRSFANSLTRIRNLQSLNLYFGDYGSEWQNITDKGLSKFCEYIGKIKKLAKFKLIWDRFRNLSDETLFVCNQHWVKLSSLKSFDLNLRQLNMIGDNGMSKISGMIGNMRQLLELRLEFKESNIPSHNGLIELAGSIGNITILKILDLNFDKCLGLRTQTIDQAVQQFGSLVMLKEIVLKFNNCNNIIGFSAFTNLFNKQKKLNELYFQINSTRMLDDSILAFCTEFKNTDNLKKMTLSFSNQRITGVSSMFISEFINRCTSLIDLELIFKGIDVTIKDLEPLLTVIKQMRDLRNVVLDFSKCLSIPRDVHMIMMDDFSTLEADRKLIVDLRCDFM